MLKDRLNGLKVELLDDEIFEQFTFYGDKVSATIGTVNGPVCAPILDLEENAPTSLQIQGQGFEFYWEDITISETQITTIRNGKAAIYKIQ